MSRFTDQTTQPAIKRQTNDGPVRNPTFEPFRRLLLEILGELGIGPGTGGGGGPTTITAAQISDATTSGRAVITSAPADARAALELGTAATKAIGVSGGVAAYDDPRIGAGGGGGGAPSTVTASQISDGSTSGRQVLTGSPSQGRDALQIAATVVQRGDNTFPGPNFATYTTAYAGVTADVGGLPLTCRAGGDTVGVTDVILGTVDLPYSGGNPRGIHAAGVAGIARTADPNMGAVGVFGAAMANAAPGRVSQVFGANFVVTNKPTLVPNVPNQGLSNCELYGVEIDVACERLANGSTPTNTHIRGTWTTGNCEVQPDGALIGHYVGFAGAFNQVPWKQAFRCIDGGADTSLMAGFQPGNGAVGSSPIVMRSRDGSNNVREGKIQTDPSGNIVIGPGGGAAVALAPNGVSSAFILNVSSLNVSSNAGVGGNLTVNGTTTSGNVTTGTLTANTGVTTAGITAQNAVFSTNINYKGKDVQQAPGNAIPGGFNVLIVQA